MGESPTGTYTCSELYGQDLYCDDSYKLSAPTSATAYNDSNSNESGPHYNRSISYHSYHSSNIYYDRRNSQMFNRTSDDCCISSSPEDTIIREYDAIYGM